MSRILGSNIEFYKSGKGYLYGGTLLGVKLVGISEDLEKYSMQDFVQYRRLIKLLSTNYLGKQTLFYRANSNFAKPMNIDIIAKRLDITKPTARSFIKWCLDNDYIRQDVGSKVYVVNPTKLLISKRITGKEYMLYKEELENHVPAKYQYMLTVEAGGVDPETGELLEEGDDYCYEED